MDYSRWICEESANRAPSAIRALMPLVRLPGMISLGGGMPNPDTFPFASVSITLKDGSKLELDEAATRTALQYSPTPGLPELVAQLEALQVREHGKAVGEDTGNLLTITTGSQDALSKAFDMVLSPGDSLLVESPTYSGSLASLMPRPGVKLVGVPTDAHGLVVEKLETVLADWDEAAQGMRPKVLYCIPTGQNPTGSTMPLARKKAVYALAQKWNLLILEDDPYRFLRLDDVDPAEAASLWSMDTDGRVIRFDSLSKVLSSGMRLGWATGPAPLITRMRLHMQSTSLHTSGVSQAFALALLKRWEQAGWERHVAMIQALYRSRRDAIAASAEKHLKGLAEWSVPSAGMFMWFKLTGISDTMSLIKDKAVAAKILLVPGESFDPMGQPSPWVRASYSTASVEDMDEAIRRLAELIRSEAAAQ